MAKRFIILFFCVCFVLGFTSCKKTAPKLSSDKLVVVSTTAMIAEVVSSIGKDKIISQCLIRGDIDPHSYELVKGDRAKLNSSKIIFYQGLGLEHGASLVSYLKAEKKAYAIGDELIKNHPEKLIYHDGYLDPHVWLDIELWQKIVPSITQKLADLDPDNRLFYEANAAELIEKMSLLDQKILDLLNQIPENKRYLVTSHSAFSYFTRRYVARDGLWVDRCIAPEGLAPEAQISLYDIEKVVAYIKLHNIQIIFSESNVSKDAIYKIIDVCSKSGLKVFLADQPLFGDAFFNNKGYFDMMWHNATLLHQAWYEQTSAAQN
jgi:manganese/zinc/iron transport system substrate-binding protein